MIENSDGCFIKDMVVQSPYQPVRAAMFHYSPEEQNVFLLKLSPTVNVKEAIDKIESVFEKDKSTFVLFFRALLTKIMLESLATKTAE